MNKATDTFLAVLLWYLSDIWMKHISEWFVHYEMLFNPSGFNP